MEYTASSGTIYMQRLTMVDLDAEYWGYCLNSLRGYRVGIIDGGIEAIRHSGSVR
jgi:hypothetical protein